MNVEEREISARALAAIVQSEEYGRRIVAVDCRSSASFKTARVKSALNMLFYSQIMRRRLLNSKNCAENVAAHLSRGVEDVTSERLSDLTLVLYGAVEKDDQKPRLADFRTGFQIPCFHAEPQKAENTEDFARVLFEKIKDCDHFERVLLLRDGFADFRRQFPDLCESSDVPPTPATPDVPLVSAAMKPEAESTPRFRCQLPSSISQPALSLAVGRRAPQSPSDSSTPTAQITQLLDHVFLGSQDDAQNCDLLKRFGISRVINLSDKGPKSDLIADDAAHFMRIPILDSYQAKILPHFDEAFQFIESARRSGDRVLIHCLAGISRSPTLAMAYVMRNRLLTCDEAYKFVQSRRPTVSPNLNFMGQLFEYERQLREQKVLPPSTRPRSNIILDSCAEPAERVEPSTNRHSERFLSKSASADFSLLAQPPVEASGPPETRKRQNESGPLAMPCRPRKLMQNCCLRRMTDQPAVPSQLPSPSTEFSKLDISFSNPCFNPAVPPTPSALPAAHSAAPMTAENLVFAMEEKLKQTPKAERPHDLNKPKAGAIALFAPLLRLHKKPPADRSSKPKALNTCGGRLRLRRFPMQRTPASVTVMPKIVDTDEDSGVASGSSVVYSSTSTDDSEGLERLASPEEPPASPSASPLRESDEADCSSTSSVEIAVK